MSKCMKCQGLLKLVLGGLLGFAVAAGTVSSLWGADDGNLTGPQRFYGYLATVMVVHAGLALLLASTPRKDGPLGTMRLSPIAQALEDAMTHPSG